MKKTIRRVLMESGLGSMNLYHGTTSKRMEKIIEGGDIKLYLTEDKDAANYYAIIGGEQSFLERENKFEEKYGITPQEYFNVEENGEMGMYMSLYPKGSKPVVITFNVPISKIDGAIGYKGKDIVVNPNEIIDIEFLDFEDFDY